ncbi:metal-dependent hydrolase [Noviherbaspirillum saxi]|uniref:Metal-dependent hydrolase n=1 Tax=Noviherbaspirillum saxi TaxID=2320863 RepID=A0A3A3FPJ0_9BURK|nr:metal-dependent hydrolase [Noviherbaspirillum saxi]RJF97380.1 metal-dependent hydrolase [Noviherbaspirillum saxi]
MDNLSHSVAGLAAGELLHRSLTPESDPARQSVRHRLLLLSCWLASNFPDLDLILTPLMPAPLGYLLHHRGHTHTMLYALPQALLLALLFWLLWPAARRLLTASRTARIGFALSLAIGFGLHLMMDYLNSYGIHPFHPFDSRWLYGDMVFILEPVFWIAFGMPLALMVPGRALKALLAALLVAISVYFTLRGFLSWGSLAALLAIAAATGIVQWRASVQGRAALALSIVFACGFVLLQYQASQRAKEIVAHFLVQRDAGTRVLDASMSAFPANPLCWAFVSVESNEIAGTYDLKRGIVSIAPDIMPPASCPENFADVARQKAATPAIALFAEDQGNLHALRSLRSENCHFDAWLRFARTPLVDNKQATDIRFASSPRGNFSTLEFAAFAESACPENVPAWGYPRLDLLIPDSSFNHAAQ